jgi:putative FmdB family regulatory protein
MPIYEFFCPACNVIYSFFSLRVDTSAQPRCPRCGGAGLERCASRFAVGKSGDSEGAEAFEGAAGLDGLEGGKLERVMELLQREAGALDESDPDPRQAGRLMRQLYETAGLDAPPGMREALRRLEAGEDPETVEAEFGDAIDAETLTDAVALAKSGRRRRNQPVRDETLYDL